MSVYALRAVSEWWPLAGVHRAVTSVPEEVIW
jgi:hypothetical protein